MISVYGGAAVIKASSCFNTSTCQQGENLFREADLMWTHGAWSGWKALRCQNQAGLSITRVVVVVFASLRGFMPVRDLYTLCSQRQEMWVILTVCLYKDLQPPSQRETSTLPSHLTGQSPHNWMILMKENILFCFKKYTSNFPLKTWG